MEGVELIAYIFKNRKIEGIVNNIDIWKKPATETSQNSYYNMENKGKW